MKTPGIFLLGLALGAAAVMLLRPDRSVEAAAAKHDAAVVAKSLAQRDTQLAEARAEQARLAGELASAKAAPAEAPVVDAAAPAAESPADDSVAERRRKFGDMIRKAGQAQMKTQLEGKVSTLRDRLQLTADQEAKLRALVGGRTDEMMAALDRFMEGRGSPADFGILVRLQRGELPDDVQSLLTPAQKSDYETFKQEDRANRIEMRANAELLGLQSGGGLTPEQKDEAFGKLSQLALNEEEVNFDAMQDNDAVWNFMEEAIQNRIDAMQPILTESQMGIYQQQIEMQRQMMSQFMPPKTK